MRITLTKGTIILEDTNFCFECYRGANIKQINGFIEFDPTSGYVILDTNCGDTVINWYADEFPNAKFDDTLEVIDYSDLAIIPGLQDISTLSNSDITVIDSDTLKFVYQDMAFTAYASDCRFRVDVTSDGYHAQCILTSVGVLVKESTFPAFDIQRRTFEAFLLVNLNNLILRLRALGTDNTKNAYL